MAQTSILNHSPIHRTLSPDISVTSYDNDNPSPKQSCKSSTDVAGLAPPSNEPKGSLSESDRYYTASSGDDYDDDDEDGLCIRLDSDDEDDDTRSLSGMRINLKTLQAVSSMLAHYSPIIQSDAFGRPTFVPPPPPPEEDYISEEDEFNVATSSKNKSSISSKRKTGSQHPRSNVSHEGADDDYNYAIQELEDVLNAQDKTLLSDAMTELTDVMEKMTTAQE